MVAILSSLVLNNVSLLLSASKLAHSEFSGIGIIVRNETAKEKLRQKVGDIGLVLFAFFVVIMINQATDGPYHSTVYESKGLNSTT